MLKSGVVAFGPLPETMGCTQRNFYLVGVLMLWLLFFRESHASVKSPHGFESDTWELQIPGFEFMSQHQVSAVQPQAPYYASVRSEMPHNQPKQTAQNQREDEPPILKSQMLRYQEKSPWSPDYKDDTRPDHQQRPLPMAYRYPQKPGNQAYGHPQRTQSQYHGYLKVSEPEVPSRQNRPQTQDHIYSQKHFMTPNQQQRTRPGVFSYVPKSNLEVPNQQRTKSQSQNYFLKPPSEIPDHQQKPQGYLQKPKPDVPAQQRPDSYLRKPQPEVTAQQRPHSHLQKNQPEVRAQQRPHSHILKPQPEVPAQQRPSGYLQKPQPEMQAQQKPQPVAPRHQQRPPSYLQKHQPEMRGQQKPQPVAPHHQQRPPTYFQKLQPELPGQQIPHGYLQKRQPEVQFQQRSQEYPQKLQLEIQAQQRSNKPQPEQPLHQRPYSYFQKPQPEGPTSKQQPYNYLRKGQLEIPVHQQSPSGYLRKSQPEVQAQHRPHSYIQKIPPGVQFQQRSNNYLQKVPPEGPTSQQRSINDFRKRQPEVPAQQRPNSYVQKPLQKIPSNEQRRQPISDVSFQKPMPEKLTTQQRQPKVHGSTEKTEAEALRHQNRPNFQSFGYPETPLPGEQNYQLKPQIQGYLHKPEAQVVKNLRTHEHNKLQPEEPSPHRRLQGQRNQQIIPSYGPQFLLSHYLQKSVPQTSNNQESAQGELDHQRNSPSLPPSYQQRPQLHKHPVQEPGYQQNPLSFRHKLSSESTLSDLQQNPPYLQRPTYQEPLRGGRSKQQKSSNKQDLQSEKSSHQIRPLPPGSGFVQGSLPQTSFPLGQAQATARQKPQSQEEQREGSKPQFLIPQQRFTSQMLGHRQASVSQQQVPEHHPLPPQGAQASEHRHGPWLWASRYSMFGPPGPSHSEE